MLTKFKRVMSFLILGGVVLLGTSAAAQGDSSNLKPPADTSSGDSEAAALAKAAQNPISSMSSLPIQYNLNLGADRYEIDNDHFLFRCLVRWWSDEVNGPDGNLRLRLGNRFLRRCVEKHIHPVYPVTVGNVNLINRLVLSVMYQPVGKGGGEFGLGDAQYTMFFSPADWNLRFQLQLMFPKNR